MKKPPAKKKGGGKLPPWMPESLAVPAKGDRPAKRGATKHGDGGKPGGHGKAAPTRPGRPGKPGSGS